MRSVVWAIAVAAVAIAYAEYNWNGVALVISIVVFWLLLAFNRTLRIMRSAGTRPVGRIGSAVMLNSKLKRGMNLLQVITITGSLGEQLSEDPDRWRWVDEGGAAVELTLVKGKLAAWALSRPADRIDALERPGE